MNLYFHIFVLNHGFSILVFPSTDIKHETMNLKQYFTREIVLAVRRLTTLNRKLIHKTNFHSGLGGVQG